MCASPAAARILLADLSPRTIAAQFRRASSAIVDLAEHLESPERQTRAATVRALLDSVKLALESRDAVALNRHAKHTLRLLRQGP